jgi:putative pyruvate formate lyase activating enzyme
MSHDKIVIGEDGETIIVGPSPEIITALNVELPKLTRVPFPNQFIPRIKLAFSFSSGIPRDGLRTVSERELIKAIEQYLGTVKKQEPLSKSISSILKANPSSSVLDVMTEWTGRALKKCQLCRWDCSVNRYQHPGRCRLDSRAYFEPLFVNATEEWGQSLTCNVAGCDWDCHFCNQPDLLIRSKEYVVGSLDLLSPEIFWKQFLEIHTRYSGKPGSPQALSIAGGNPDDSLDAVLRVLSKTPFHFELPMIWQTNGYTSADSLKIIAGISDGIAVSYKFSDACASTMGAPPKCLSASLRNLEWLTTEAPPTLIIARLLLLPGHVDCCFKKIVDSLVEYRDRIWVTLLDAYVPSYKASGNLTRFLKGEEIETAKSVLRKAKFRLTDSWVEMTS